LPSVERQHGKQATVGAPGADPRAAAELGANPRLNPRAEVAVADGSKQTAEQEAQVDGPVLAAHAR